MNGLYGQRRRGIAESVSTREVIPEETKKKKKNPIVVKEPSLRKTHGSSSGGSGRYTTRREVL